MNLTYSNEQRLLRDSVDDFARDYRATLRMRSLSDPHGFDRATWRAITALGWLGIDFPESLGGCDGNTADAMIVHEGIGAGLILEPLLPAALAARVIHLTSTYPERARVLPPLLRGERLIVLAHDEVAARGEIAHVETRAITHAAGWVLAGTKVMVLAAPAADHLIVSARADTGIMLFLLDRASLAGRLRVCRTIDGFTAADLHLDGLAVTVSEVLAKGQGVLEALAQAQDHALVAACAEALGAMGTALTITAEHLKTREQFGVPLASFQALQHKVADMVIAAEQARSILLYGLASLDEVDPVARGRGVAAAMVGVIDAAAVIGRHAVQLHGGLGVTEEHIISHYFRRLAAFPQRWGGVDHHLARFTAMG